jgi:hypothetical protein
MSSKDENFTRLQSYLGPFLENGVAEGKLPQTLDHYMGNIISNALLTAQMGREVDWLKRKEKFILAYAEAVVTDDEKELYRPILEMAQAEVWDPELAKQIYEKWKEIQRETYGDNNFIEEEKRFRAKQAGVETDL